jgi:YfiH family protein
MNIPGFRLRETAGIRYYTCDAFDQAPGLRHGFSTRSGGVSGNSTSMLNLGPTAWDVQANVLENRRRFLAALDLPHDCLATASQEHSAEFHIINAPIGQWNPQTRGDALATNSKRIALAVQVADCFPVLVFDPQTGSIAAVHAGWRGTLARILQRTLEGMKHCLGMNPADAWVAIGPGIRPCCLEVGPEVASAFEAAFPGARLHSPHSDTRDKYLLDLPRALMMQLSETGVPLQQRFDLGLCTRCHPDEFFSYRAEGNQAGRMMGIIGRIGYGGLGCRL